ncbi:hypothetical protein I6E46_05290 [Prevotella loescheii]|nr:hypothetical protein [Hoylesella loescheii]
MERKGICKNVGVCSKANKVQIITDDDADFVCLECGEELQPYVEDKVPEKGKSKTPILIGVAVIVLAIIIGCVFAFTGGSNEPEVAAVDSTKVDSSAVAKTDTVTIVKTDTIKQIDTVTIEKTVEKVETPKATKTTTTTTKTSKASGSAKGSVNLGYAKFTGAVSGGKPNGQGTMRFTSSHVIDSRDPKGRVADAGDYVIGEWVSGKLVQGRWYGSDNNVKGSIIIGM